MEKRRLGEGLIDKKERDLYSKKDEGRRLSTKGRAATAQT